MMWRHQEPMDWQAWRADADDRNDPYRKRESVATWQDSLIAQAERDRLSFLARHTILLILGSTVLVCAIALGVFFRTGF